MTSLSTRFLGHPRLTKPTFTGLDSEGDGSAASVIVEFSTGMCIFHCSIGNASVSAGLHATQTLISKNLSQVSQCFRNPAKVEP